MNDKIALPGELNRRMYRLRDTPFVLRWTVVITQLCVPYIVYLIVSALFSYQYAIGDGVGFALLGMLVSTIVTVCLLIRGRSVLGSTVAGVVLSVAVLAAWLAVSPIQPLIAFYLGLIAYALYRVRQLATSESASEVNRRTFRFDSIVLTVIVSLFALSSSGLTSPPAILVSEAVAVLLLLYVFARIYVLWRFERLETGTERASRVGLYIIVAAAVVLALWGPFVLVHAAFILLAIAGTFQLLWLWIWSLFDIHITPHSRNPQSTTTQSKGHHNLPPAAHGLTQHQMNSFWLIAGGLVAAVALTALFLSKRRTTESVDQTQEPAEIASVTRKWVKPSKSISFLRTHHPIRLEYQRWLRKQQQQGVDVRLNETARQLLSKNVDEDGPRIQSLIPLYEQARYQKPYEDPES